MMDISMENIIILLLSQITIDTTNGFYEIYLDVLSLITL